jgi:hypothetical protein
VVAENPIWHYSSNRLCAIFPFAYRILESKDMETTEKDKTRILLLGLIFLFCTMIAMQALARDQSEDTRKASGTGWQHLALTYKIGETPETDLAKEINKLGREGWEMVAVGDIIASGTTTQTVFYFKKPL